MHAQVCGVYGSWHLGQLQVGLSRAIRLAQCRRARITALEALPMQIDGEPWRQPPATLDISLKGQVHSPNHPVGIRSLMHRKASVRPAQACEAGDVVANLITALNVNTFPHLFTDVH